MHRKTVLLYSILSLICPIVHAQTNEQINHELLAVFGKSSLNDRMLERQKKEQKPRKFGFKKNKSKKVQAKQEALWFAKVLEDMKNRLPFDSAMELGSNSNTDVYVEINAQKKWLITPDFNVQAEQTLRYGSESRNYSETQFNFTKKQSTKAFASNNFSIVKTYEETITWDDKLYRQQNLDNDNQLSYGLYSSGVYNKESKDLDIQSWGPYFAWRLPLWRDWVYLENELSYYKDATVTEGYSFSVGLKLEATF